MEERYTKEGLPVVTEDEAIVFARDIRRRIRKEPKSRNYFFNEIKKGLKATRELILF
ncbi:hypothetical protein J4402_05505 [Candidatus Pacearchaeota archaeon]|nr:hypothetical protein [Candidatus Pacearchaeota archaeon]